MSLKRQIAKIRYALYRLRQKSIFADFPLYGGENVTEWDKFMAKVEIVLWRIRKCDHDTPACLDIGDEEHNFIYCYRCGRKLGYYG